jgi:hypothetical protein
VGVRSKNTSAATVASSAAEKGDVNLILRSDGAIDRPMSKHYRFPPAAAAASRIAGVPANEFFFEVDGAHVIVNHNASMKWTPQMRKDVEAAVQANLPPEHRRRSVSVV